MENKKNKKNSRFPKDRPYQGVQSSSNVNFD